MKKIMILGAASGQVPFIEISKKLGCEVIVVSPQGNYPGFKYADKIYNIDTRDKDAILRVAEKEKIDAITTDQTDVSVPAVAYVAEKLGIRGIGYECAIRFSDKYLMRTALKNTSVGIPKFFKAQSIDDILTNINGLSFPIMIKPTNSSGSRGVHRVNQFSEIENAYADSVKYSSTNEVIVEEFIEGEEYIVDGFALDGKYINLDIGIKEYFDIDGMYISKMCMFSSAALAKTNVERKLLEANSNTVKNLNLKFGLTHGEYIYSKKEDKVYLVEIAARGGGVNLSSDLTPKSSGINTNQILLEYLVNGQIVDLDTLTLDKKVSAWRCFELSPGIIESIEGVEMLNKIPGVFKSGIDYLKIGQKIGPLINDTRKYGPILVWGYSKQDCYKAIEKAKETLKISVRRENGTIENIKW